MKNTVKNTVNFTVKHVTAEGVNGSPVVTDMEELLADDGLTRDALQELKAFLFRENIRLVTAEAELAERQERFQQEKKQFQEEMRAQQQTIATEKRRAREDGHLIDRKLEILKDGFQKLDMDRRRLAREQARLTAEKEFLEERGLYDGLPEVSVFFHGVKNPLALKKRYKDLSKIFHPDNLSGDTELIQKINREYESLKREFERCMQA